MNVKETLLEQLNQSYWQDTGRREDSIKKVKSLRGSFVGADFYLQHDYLEDRLKNEVRFGLFYFDLRKIMSQSKLKKNICTTD